MNLSEEWRFLWPASQSSEAPPVIPSNKSVGPVVLRAVPATLTTVLSSQSVLSPPCLPPLPVLSLSSFLRVFSVPISDFDSEDEPIPSYAPHFSRNRLEPLPFPDGSSTLAFFPTGDNLDRVGFVLLDSHVRAQAGTSLAPCSFGHRILQLAARQSSEDDVHDCLGFLAASTMYSVHWFRVMLRGRCTGKPVLDYLGKKLFKSSVAHVCWSPHLPEECIVLLETGQLFLYGIASSSSRKKLPEISWDNEMVKPGGWLSCEFCWHPQIVVVANSEAVFLVDFRHKKCRVDCLFKVSLLIDVVESDRFLSFSKAGSDGFHFVVVSKCWLVLIDIRVLCKPVLQWMHNLQNPCNVSVFSLSRLRGDLGNEEYNHASEVGYGIVLSSFWNGDFSLFCFGPCLKQQPLSSNMPIKASQPFYAWDLPSELSLSGRDCPKSSSDCLLRQEFSKDCLPEWIDWQLKKELVLGFIILGKDMSSLSSMADGDVSGFMLVRLMSSGKLESQSYNICWAMPNDSESDHVFPSGIRDFHLLCMDEESEFDWKLRFIKLVYLYAYMNGSLTDALLSQSERLQGGVGRGSKKRKTTSTSLSLSVCDAIKGILGMSPSTSTDQNQLPPFILRKPSAFSDALFVDVLKKDNARYNTMIAKLAEDKQGGAASYDGSDMFDDLTPICLDSIEGNLGSKEMHAYAILKHQCEKSQQRFTPYAEFCAQSNI